jgi:hypothetical protein
MLFRRLWNGSVLNPSAIYIQYFPYNEKKDSDRENGVVNMATLAKAAWERGDNSRQKRSLAFSTYYCSVFTCPSTVSPIPEIPVAKKIYIYADW